jgi:RNA polymerase sigma-70 factor (ECF subfamily)
MLRNPEDAEDLIQEVFLAFYKKMEKIKPATYLGYLYRTAHNKSLNLIRRKSRKSTVALNMRNPEHLSRLRFDEQVPDKNSELIRKAFLALKPEEAMLIELQFYSKMSYSDIARKLSLSVSAVDSRLVRAKKKLKKIISQDLETRDVHINKEMQNG